MLFVIWVIAVFIVDAEGLWRGEAPGSPLSEAPGHLWLLARACEQFFSSGPLSLSLTDVNMPAGLDWVLMDPINTLWGLPAFHLLGGGATGAIWAAQSVVLCNLGLAVIGGFVAGRHFGGSRAAGIVTATALCLTPPLLGLIATGYSEKYPVGWMALHYVALDLTLRHIAKGRARSTILNMGALAALSGIAACYSGWYMVVILWLCDGLFVVNRLLRSRGRTRWRVLGGALLLALSIFIALLPAIAAMDGHGPRGEDPSTIQPIVPGMQQLGSEASAFGAGGFELQHMIPYVHKAKTPLGAPIDPILGAWVSGVLVLLMIWAWRQGRGRKTEGALGPWILITAFVALMMMGHFLVFKGEALTLFGRTIWLPVHWLSMLFPPLLYVSFWGKLSAVFALHLGLLAAVLVGRLPPGKARWVALVLPVFVAGETLLSTGYVPFGAQRMSYEVRAPQDLITALDRLELPPGQAILQLPMDNSQPRAEDGATWPYALWQLSHKRPIAENYLSSDHLLERVPALGKVFWTRNPIGPGTHGLQLESGLAQNGIGAVLLHRDRAVSVGQWKRKLEGVLGPPSFELGPLVVWRIPSE
jgi:hypothetical protein